MWPVSHPRSRRTRDSGLITLRAVIGSAAAPSKFGILNNLNMFWNKPSSPYSGVVTDGFGSGSSPAAYITDPLTGFVAASKEQDRHVAIDGFFSDDPTEGIVIGETGPSSPIDTKLMNADAAFVFVSAVAMEGYDRPNLEVSRAGPEIFCLLESSLKPSGR